MQKCIGDRGTGERRSPTAAGAAMLRKAQPTSLLYVTPHRVASRSYQPDGLRRRVERRVRAS